jgi:hypothetical protein
MPWQRRGGTGPRWAAFLLLIGVLGVASLPAREASAQAAPPSASDQIRTATEALGQARAALAATRPETLTANAPTIDASLRSATTALTAIHDGEVEFGHQTDALWMLVVLTLVFLLVSAGGLLLLARQVRTTFWDKAAGATDNSWRTYLMQLPLGAPEGSVRALISLYMIVFGLLALVMQKRLGLTSAEAITGFLGAVIAFYFTARSNDVAQQAASSAEDAAKAAASASAAAGKVSDSARTSMAEASDKLAQAHSALTEATSRVQAVPSAAPAAPDPAPLRQAADDLQVARQTLGMLKNLGEGVAMPEQLDGLLGEADGLLAGLDKLVSGAADAKNAGDLLSAAAPLLERMNAAGVPGLLGGAIAALTPAARLLGPALAGIPGGPVGIIGGLVMGGLQVLDDQRKFDAWKSALLAKPFDRSLLPPVVDGNLALLVLQLSPLMKKRLEGQDPGLATELLRQVLTLQEDGSPAPTEALATQLLQDPRLQPLFGSAAELEQALDEYRAGAIFQQASNALSGQVAVPPIDGVAPAQSVDMTTLLRAALQLRADPRAASALDQVVYVVQALGALHLAPEKMLSVVQTGLQLATKLAADHQAEEPRS